MPFDIPFVEKAQFFFGKGTVSNSKQSSDFIPEAISFLGALYVFLETGELAYPLIVKSVCAFFNVAYGELSACCIEFFRIVEKEKKYRFGIKVKLFFY